MRLPIVNEQRQTRASVRQLLGVTDERVSVTCEFAKTDAGDWTIWICFPNEPKFGMELSIRDDRRPAWQRGKIWQLSYRQSPDGTDPYAVPTLRRHLERLKAHFERVEGGYPQLDLPDGNA